MLLLGIVKRKLPRLGPGVRSALPLRRRHTQIDCAGRVVRQTLSLGSVGLNAPVRSTQRSQTNSLRSTGRKLTVTSSSSASHIGRPRAFDAIVYSGLVAGILDLLAASINAYLRGTSPERVWQYVASGLLGASSYGRGYVSVLLGVFCHFLIAFSAAAVFFFASLRFPILIQRAVIFGIVYGVLIYFFMSRLVVPLSAARTFPFSLEALLTGLAIHIVCVGLPIALLTRRAGRVG